MRNHRRVPSTAASSILALTVCLLPARPASGQEVIELPAEDRWLEPDFHEVYRVGLFGGPEWQQFGMIASVAFNEDGTLHILDGQAARAFVVGLDGQLIREYGRPGEGPGEFEDARWIGVAERGRGIVFDYQRNGFHIFDSDGEIERLARLPGDYSFMPEQLDVLQGGGITLVPNGTVTSLSLAAAFAGNFPATATATRPVVRLVLDGDAVRPDTLAVAWMPSPEQLRFRGPSGTDQERRLTPPLLVGVLPGGGVAFSDTSAHRISITDPEGTIERVLTRPFAPKPMTDRMREVARQQDLEVFERELEVFERDYPNRRGTNIPDGVIAILRATGRVRRVLPRVVGDPRPPDEPGGNDLDSAERRRSQCRGTDRCPYSRRSLSGQLSQRHPHAGGFRPQRTAGVHRD